jgi:hypothetical protein
LSLITSGHENQGAIKKVFTACCPAVISPTGGRELKEGIEADWRANAIYNPFSTPY